jgi:hypothetical protein
MGSAIIAHSAVILQEAFSLTLQETDEPAELTLNISAKARREFRTAIHSTVTEHSVYSSEKTVFSRYFLTQKLTLTPQLQFFKLHR